MKTTLITTRPNESDTLKHVLGAIAYMMEHDQVEHGAAPLVNILNAVEGFDSDSMATFRQTLAARLHVDKMNYPAPVEPYELWESDERGKELGYTYQDAQGHTMGFMPPFLGQISKAADVAPVAPALTDNEEQYDEYVLSASQVKLICKALDALIAAKGDKLTVEEDKEIDELCQCLA